MKPLILVVSHALFGVLGFALGIARFNTVVLWCETFHQFISSAKCRQSP
jgi:hypothetical protein